MGSISTVLIEIGVMLAHKLNFIALKSFIEASAQCGLKPMVIFQAKAFERFHFQDYRLKHLRRSDNSWIFFFSHAFPGHKRTASLWVDIEQEMNRPRLRGSSQTLSDRDDAESSVFTRFQAQKKTSVDVFFCCNGGAGGI